LCILLFALANIVLFPLLYRPLRNASLLARHMSRMHSHVLIPYSGPVSNDEVGNLIKEYNSLVERTNTTSETLRQKEILLRNAQIETLQSQLDPHFFYGTLESIRMVAEAHHETLIADIAYAFGNLMRYSLSREYFVPVQTEIDIVKQYLEIQKKRLGSRFTVSWNLQISSDGWICPKFVLFSMVENVIVHDISQTRKQVHIHIDIIQEEEDLSITVTNDGPGIPPERLARLQYLKDHPEERSSMSSQNNGRSIFNINDRLQLYYGSDYKFTVTSQEYVKTVCSIRFNMKPDSSQAHTGEVYQGGIQC
jgi:two-component system, sensor histidine kinase YesM